MGYGDRDEAGVLNVAGSIQYDNVDEMHRAVEQLNNFPY